MCLSLQACNEGNIFATTKLLALGAEVNYSTTNNSTTAYPLCAAVAAGDPHLVDLLIRHGAKPTGSPYDDPLSVAAELLLRDAVAAGLCLPDEFKCTGCNSVEEKHIAACGEALAMHQSLLRSISVLSWVEGEMSTPMGGLFCCRCCCKNDFLQTAAGVPPVSSLIWPCGDPLEVCLPVLC